MSDLKNVTTGLNAFLYITSTHMHTHTHTYTQLEMLSLLLSQDQAEQMGALFQRWQKDFSDRSTESHAQYIALYHRCFIRLLR